ncbi:MAG: hypothetical protein ACO1Q7_08075 [Gemmatimonas sp.]
MKITHITGILAAAATFTLAACGPREEAPVDDTTAMTLEAPIDPNWATNDSVRIADSLHMDSLRRADSIRIIDPLHGPPPQN